MKISLTFDTGLSLEAELFEDHPVAKALYNNLPLDIGLTTWGEEAYGSTGQNFGKHKPQPTIPPGGLAFTDQGNYFCIFYGQTPAWDVDYIGQISTDWPKLRGEVLSVVHVDKA